ncbi:OLC1v1032612C1 [Oldenlandia corymbosa var. corymbosa]|uniref:OLC1v1032612C1 n=1 Tax=Oldenlandia corymbosa var. corymbosa TaxID=529605 RepID=A0AAV1CM09_OLDCO|nr:OLC1v1032612C1 [Oldenlandia corymbosa var. corymbosa]
MASPSPISPSDGGLKRKDFPDDFVFGFAASAYQYEGGAQERGTNIWDTFLEKYHPKVVEKGGLNAIDHYHRYEEDIRIMKEMGIDSYRFSISWSRVLPNGRKKVGIEVDKYKEWDGVNYKGIEFYKQVISDLKANGIEPMVTLFHWDLPQALEDEYGGFLDKREPKKIVQDYCDYAKLCFEHFGKDVKRWLTFNEPWNFAIGGYATALHAPGRGGDTPTLRRAMAAALPPTRDPKTEPYIVAHNILLAHAAVVKLYRTQFQKEQKGEIGISCESIWTEPLSDTAKDQAAADRVLDFMFGWFLNPITYGQYPTVMLDRLSHLGRPLPPFSDDEQRDLKGSYDFLGLNYYTSNYVYDDEAVGLKNSFYTADSGGKCTPFRDGVPIGEQAGSRWLYVYPKGIRKLLVHIKDKYGDPVIYITENGRDELRDDNLSLWESFYDYKRIEYHHQHLLAIKKSMDESKVRVKGYHAWTLMDNLEWSSGFNCRFGTNFIDFNDNLKSDFPDDFVFGFAASAYQYEGGADERGPNIWDTFLAKYHPDVLKDGGLNAIDHYHRYEEDIRIMKEMGIDSYRFSISWSRVLPTGRRVINPLTGKEEGVNYKGIQFYQRLIRELKANGIEPMVTIFHWDLPEALEDEYLGFLDRSEPKKIVRDYCDYAKLCFEYFGDHVKRWLTFNEPWNFCIGGYATGQHAPGRGGSRDLMREIAAYLPSSRVTSAEIAAKIPSTPVEGDPKTEPYLVAHNILLAHAAAVKLYRTHFQEKQKGEIGIACESIWAEPYHPTSTDDQDAAERVLEFMYGWFLNPVTYGQYPTVMIDRLKAKGRPLPPFSDDEQRDLKGSYDFLGLNYYTSNYVYNDESDERKGFYTVDSGGRCTPFDPEGKPIGEKAGSDWLYVYPKGLLELLYYIQKKYLNPNIYITENGRDELRDDKLSLWQSFYDYKRIEYHYKHLSAIKTALNKDDVRVKGYHAWSLMDNLEWENGFKCRFGTNFIDFNDTLKRYPKLSAAWFKYFLQKDHN